MEFSVEEVGKLKRKIAVEVPLKDVESTYNEVYAQLKGHIKVNGFRPGKFPRQLAEKRFQTLMQQEATRTLLPRYFDEALKEMKVRPATQPQFSNVEIDKKKPFKFEAEFEVTPDIKLPKPADFKLKEEKAKISKADLDSRIEDIRKARATFEDKGDAAAVDGDVVVLDFRGTIDGEDFRGNTGTDHRVELGAGQFLEDFEKQLKKVKKGDKKTFDLKFPDEYDPSVAGKTAQFDVEIKKVEQRALPELDKAFFNQFGEEVETLEDFRKQVEENMTREKEREILSGYQQSIADQIKDSSKFDVPETLVEQYLKEYEHQLSHDDPEALKDEKKLTKLKKEQEEKIISDLRLGYVLDEWARENQIAVPREEVQQRFFMQAYMMQQNPSELIKTPYGEQMLYQMEQQILSSKVLEDLSQKVLEGKPAAPAKKAPAKKEKEKETKAKE